MSTIRVDPGALRKAANDIALVAERLRTAGNQLHQSTQGAPGYDGQFGSQVATVGVEGLARLRSLADRLAERSAWLAARAEAFEVADAAALQGLTAIRQELLAWVHSQGALPLADLFSPVESADRPPPGISEEDWHRLTLTERISLWVEALRGDGRQTQAMPTIPVPAPLAPDPGSGEFGSMEPTLADFAFERVLLLGADFWELPQGRPDAARHMRHYLEGSGEPLEVDVGRMLEDMPLFQQRSQGNLETFLLDIEGRVEQEYRGEAMNFKVVSPWILAPYSEAPNWYYAMGGFHYAYGAEVTVSPPSTAEGNPTVEIAHRMYVSDYYNWDEGKSVTIPRPTMPLMGEPISLPIPEEYRDHIREVRDNWVVADAAQARLHLGGLAREYEITGRTEVSTVNYTFDPQTMQWAPAAPPPAAPAAGR